MTYYNWNSIFIDVSLTANISKHNNKFRSGDLGSKLLLYSIEIDYYPNFEKVKGIKPNCNNYESRVSCEGS